MEEYIKKRINELMRLKDGWINGDEGKAISPQIKTWFMDIFVKNYKSNKLPCIFPTESGDIQLEWTIGKIEIILEICLTSHYGIFNYFDTNTKDIEGWEDIVLNLDNDDSWKIINLIMNLTN